MITLVIDVAAEHSGAVTILNQFISEFENDKNNSYIVVLSIIEYCERSNIKFIYYKWVKKSYLHRLLFDLFIVPRLIRKIKPDKILSLQNNAYSVNNIYQEVYFQNILPLSDIKFKFFESKTLWIYQNVIGKIIRRSLKYADKIIVQADWIRKKIVNKWNIEENKIEVKKPYIDIKNNIKEYHPNALFYPSNGNIYKNHITLLKALIPIWEKYNAPEIRFTGTLENLPHNCQEIIKNNSCHVKFLGMLTKEEMMEQYRTSILVFPSYIETIGLPLIEAKSVGGIIIASDCEYVKETIENYINISYFPAFDNNILRKLIENRCLKIGII